MKYLVIYYETYVGYFFDENTYYFDEKAEATRYCDELNKRLAEENNCKMKDLGDFYVVEEIKKKPA